MNSEQDQHTDFDNEKSNMLRTGRNTPSTNANQLLKPSHDSSFDDYNIENRQKMIINFAESGIGLTTNRFETLNPTCRQEILKEKEDYPSYDSIEQKDKVQNDIKPSSHFNTKLSKQNISTEKTDQNLNAQKEKEEFLSKNTSLHQSEYFSNLNSGSPMNIRSESNQYTKTPRLRSKDIFFYKAQQVRRFINKLKSKTMNYLISLMNKTVFELLGDKSSDFNQFVIQRNTKRKVNTTL